MDQTAFSASDESRPMSMEERRDRSRHEILELLAGADADLGRAATVVVLRDAPVGSATSGSQSASEKTSRSRLEVLLMERPSDRGSFRGALVFPGGRIDPEDGDDRDAERTARVAAVRELFEETGLVADASTFIHIGRLHPPASNPARFHTWFFAAPAPEGDLIRSAEEAVSLSWRAPEDVLADHAAGRATLWPPTWAYLRELSSFESSADALAHFESHPPEWVHARLSADRRVLIRRDDSAWFADEDLEVRGMRDRIDMRQLPWMRELG